MKSKDTWTGEQVQAGTDELGFSIVAAGGYATGTGYSGVGEIGYLVVEGLDDDNKYSALVINGVTLDLNNYTTKNPGFHASVRCMKILPQ